MESLAGMRLVEIRRIVDMVVVVFRRDDGVEYAIHASCPVRVMHGDVILIGSYDMHHAKVRGADSNEAFENFTTMYDVRAKSLTSSFAEGDFRVTSADLGPGGLLVAEEADGSDSIRVEVIPMSSGPKVESWRLFAVEEGAEHFVYPEAAGRD
ncbi:hypothetical protein ABJI51_11400 [Amycolatopsis sp. NEAU-NG30]|uniref:Uncharacterized protein n=1 Tax=Amycolatopsis melonis TaxID=3156488 RepID=A0ABV0LBL5_9PSEU